MNTVVYTSEFTSLVNYSSLKPPRDSLYTFESTSGDLLRQSRTRKLQIQPFKKQGAFYTRQQRNLRPLLSASRCY
jgi:hypothetical protein